MKVLVPLVALIALGASVQTSSAAVVLQDNFGSYRLRPGKLGGRWRVHFNDPAAADAVDLSVPWCCGFRFFPGELAFSEFC